MAKSKEELSEIKRKNVAARWAKQTKEERKEFASKIGKISADRRKKYGWGYWKKKDEADEQKNT